MSKKHCVVGYYFSVEDILVAARKTRSRNFDKFDTFTPFAIHGMESAMGIPRTKLPYISFLAGCLGLSLAAGLTIWTHYYSYPINIGGKPLFSLPAYIPIMFELTILLCGVISAVTMFVIFLKLPNLKKPIFHPDITNDRFALAIETSSESEIEPVKKFLEEIKAQEVHAVEGAL